MLPIQTQLCLSNETILIPLRDEHNFAWLSSYFVRIFSVFDQQDSGNLSFGCIDSQSKSFFVKYAGAHPCQFDGNPKDAIARLRRAVGVYHDLQSHEHLLPLERSFSVEETGGFTLVFPWFSQGECLHSHWIYPPPAKYEHSQSPYYRFRQLSIDQRVSALEKIFAFIEHVNRHRYITIDFYDGSILYNFETNTLKICDIDFFEKMPCQPAQPPWGSPRYLAPEELNPDALLDERTNVFRMGAFAFGLLGGELDRSQTKWEANASLYFVAHRAVAHQSSERYANVNEFLIEWYHSK